MWRSHVLFAALSSLLVATAAFAQTTVQLTPTPIQRFVDSSGNALSGGKLFVYAAGTTTKITTYTDSTGATPQTNPIILNARGEPENSQGASVGVWVPPSQPYKMVLSPSTDSDPPTNAIWTLDNINSSTTTANNNTQLSALPISLGSVLRLGYATVGDAPAQTYVASNAVCTIGGGDGGSQVPSSDGKCWVTTFPASGADAREWGVIANGSDITTNLQKAINWVESATATLNIVGSSTSYTISSTLTIGNGSASSLSTQNGFQIKGVSVGTGQNETVPAVGPVTFLWNGAVGGTAFSMLGPISAVELSGLKVNCNSKCATGFSLNTPISSKFENLLVESWTAGPAYVFTTVPFFAGIATGAQHNLFNNVRSENPGANGSGILIGPSSVSGGAILDPAQTTFINSQFTYDASPASVGTYGIGLQGTDNLVFIATGPSQQGGTNGFGIKVMPPAGNTGLPSEITFFHSAIGGNCNNPGAGWTAAHGIGFFPYPLSDGETVCGANVVSQYYGYTTTGVPFGITNKAQISGNSGTTAIVLAGATFYVGQGCAGAAGLSCGIPMQYGGTIKNLFANLSTAPTGAETVAFTAWKNGSTQTLTCTISAANTTCNDATHGFTVVQGDTVVMKVVGSAGAATAVAAYSFQFLSQ